MRNIPCIVLKPWGGRKKGQRIMLNSVEFKALTVTGRVAREGDPIPRGQDMPRSAPAGGFDGTYQRRDMHAATPPLEGRAPVDTGARSGEGVQPAEILVSDYVRELARNAGLDLASVEGTGQNGRILKKDVEAVLAARESAE